MALRLGLCLPARPPTVGRTETPCCKWDGVSFSEVVLWSYEIGEPGVPGHRRRALSGAGRVAGCRVDPGESSGCPLLLRSQPGPPVGPTLSWTWSSLGLAHSSGPLGRYALRMCPVDPPLGACVHALAWALWRLWEGEAHVAGPGWGPAHWSPRTALLTV